MTRDEQIVEMAEEINEVISHNLIVTINGKVLGFDDEGVARELFDDGWRKASDVINEVEQFIFMKYGEYFDFSELKKKYTEDATK